MVFRFVFRVIACLLCLLHAPARKRFRAIINEFYEQTFGHGARRFARHEVAPRSVLVVEPNNGHGIVLPGIANYFYDLGFSVDVFITEYNARLNPFAKMPAKRTPNVFAMEASTQRFALSASKISEYDYVFIATSVYFETSDKQRSFMRYLEFEPMSSNGVMLIEDDKDRYFELFDEHRYLSEHRLFTLLGYDGTPRLSTHYFGDVARNHKKSSVTTFVVVGVITSSNKNYELLLSAVESLKQRGITNFTIKVVGRGELTIPECVKGMFHILGELTYQDMFAEIEESDFILSLLDPANEDHMRYSRGATSGTFLLMLGFNIPCLIDEYFAKPIGLTGEQALLYTGHDLEGAMRRAILMPADDYGQMRDKIRLLSESVYALSLSNLDDAIHKIEIRA